MTDRIDEVLNNAFADIVIRASITLNMILEHGGYVLSDGTLLRYCSSVRKELLNIV